MKAMDAIVVVVDGDRWKLAVYLLSSGGQSKSMCMVHRSIPPDYLAIIRFDWTTIGDWRPSDHCMLAAS